VDHAKTLVDLSYPIQHQTRSTHARKPDHADPWAPMIGQAFGQGRNRTYRLLERRLPWVPRGTLLGMAICAQFL